MKRIRKNGGTNLTLDSRPFRQTLGIIIFVLAAAFSGAAAASAVEVRQLSLEELKAKYELPNSQYIDIDGVKIHFVDEGSGPTVVLAHASYLNLQAWNGVAAELKKKYRVVRFDFPAAGLSGFETKPVPPEKFDLIERNTEILAGFADTLKLDEFSLVGTSSGGSVTFRYAARHPDRISRLLLINSAGMPRTPQTDPLRERLKFEKWAEMDVRPKEFWALGYSETFIAPHKVPEWLLDQVYDFNRRKNQRANNRETYRFSTGDPKAILANIRAPTLIMWGLDNPVVMHLEADVIEHWMTGALTLVRKYDGLGHYPYVEDQKTILKDFEAFLAGELDDQFRQTARLKPSSDCLDD